MNMNSDHEGCRTRLFELTTLREGFEIRADLLPADLALLGLLDDLLDASTVAIQFADKSIRTVYPLVRTAFEASQRIVALATDDDYLRLGTRAWLYYQHKDASVRRKTEAEKADQWLDATVSRMRDIWTPHNEKANELLTREDACLMDLAKKKGRLPDNFTGRDLADVVQDCYKKIYGPDVPRDLKQLNRGIYSALSRDSHARLRVEPAALTIQPNGTVRVIPHRVDETAKRRTLLHCLESSLKEAQSAISYLLDARRRADVEKLRSLAARAAVSDLLPGFSPDLGLRLAQLGGAKTVFHFRNVPILKLGVLPNGIACWSANIVLADREYIATFDVPALLRSDLARAVGVSPATFSPTREIVKHNVAGSPTVSLECTLGEVQHNGNETFVPLIVTRLECAEARHGA